MSNFSPQRSSSQMSNNAYYAQPPSMLDSKGTKINESPGSAYSRCGQENCNPNNRSKLNSFPKPLPSRILTPRNAPNDLFRKLETKLKESNGSSSTQKGRPDSAQIIGSSLLSEKCYNPEHKIKEHIRALISSMRALRDIPKEYFQKSYFIQRQGGQVNMESRNSISTVEDILKEGRKTDPEMPPTQLFKNVNGAKVVSL